MKPYCSTPSLHREGYAVRIYDSPVDSIYAIRLAVAYGATPDEAAYRARTIAAAFEREIG